MYSFTTLCADVSRPCLCRESITASSVSECSRLRTTRLYPISSWLESTVCRLALNTASKSVSKNDYSVQSS